MENVFSEAKEYLSIYFAGITGVIAVILWIFANFAIRLFSGDAGVIASGVMFLRLTPTSSCAGTGT